MDSQESTAKRLRQQRQRAHAFRQLLDPTNLLPGHNVADLYSLRHLCLQGDGIPEARQSEQGGSNNGSSTFGRQDDGWLRAQAWRVLLGYLGPDKADWDETLARRRAEYYRFVEDLLPASPPSETAISKDSRGPQDATSEHDELLIQIYRDLSRSRASAFAFYRQPVPPSSSCPLTVVPTEAGPSATAARMVPRIQNRHSLLQQLLILNNVQAEDLRHDESLDMLYDTSILIDAMSSQTDSSTQEVSIDAIGNNGRSRTTESNIGGADDSLANAEGPFAADNFTDVRWHSMLRILYIYALLNPSVGYVQGMNEVLFVLVYVLSSSPSPPSNTGRHSAESQQASPSDTSSYGPTQSDSVDALYAHETCDDRDADAPSSTSSGHAEADAFWCFSALLGEMRELYDFGQVDAAIAGLQASHDRQGVGGRSRTASFSGIAPLHGIARALQRFSLRLQWLDEELHRALQDFALDPLLPHYSLRWLTCLLSTEVSLPSVLRIWDVVFSEPNASASSEEQACSPKIEFLIDTCCALLIAARTSLLTILGGNREIADGDDFDGAFAAAIAILQDLSEVDIAAVMETAVSIRQRRLSAPLTGDGPSDDFAHSPENRTPTFLKGWSARWPKAGPRLPSEGINGRAASNEALSMRFQRYADAVSTSDAAATLSKAKSNLQARALATRDVKTTATAETTRDAVTSVIPDLTKATSQTRKISLSDIGSKWRAKGFGSFGRSDKAADLLVPGSGSHPSLRWSKTGIPPDLPLPDLTTEHREDESPAVTACSTPESKSALTSFASPSPGSQGTHLTDTNTTFGRFAHLPSLANAVPKTDVPLPGMPKPLLLQRAAGPPRESPTTDRLRATQLASRKVSSGPLAAAAASPTHAAHAFRPTKSSDESGLSSAGSNSRAQNSVRSNDVTPSATQASEQGSSRSSQEMRFYAVDGATIEGVLPSGYGSPHAGKSSDSVTMAYNESAFTTSPDGSLHPDRDLPAQNVKDFMGRRTGTSQSSMAEPTSRNSSSAFVVDKAPGSPRQQDEREARATSPPLRTARDHRLTLGRKASSGNFPFEDPGLSEKEGQMVPSLPFSGTAFGGVSSSSNIPLATQKASLQRNFRRKASEGATSTFSADGEPATASSPKAVGSRRPHSGSTGTSGLYGPRAPPKRPVRQDPCLSDAKGVEGEATAQRPTRGTRSGSNYI